MTLSIKFKYSEKATEFEKKSPTCLDIYEIVEAVTSKTSGSFFQIVLASSEKSRSMGQIFKYKQYFWETSQFIISLTLLREISEPCLALEDISAVDPSLSESRVSTALTVKAVRTSSSPR